MTLSGPLTKIYVDCVVLLEPCVCAYLSYRSNPPVVFSSGCLFFKLGVFCPRFLAVDRSFRFLFKNNSSGSRGKRYFQEFISVFLCGF